MNVCVVVHLPDPVEAGWVDVLLLLVPTVTVAARLLTAFPALAMETLAMMITRSTSPKHPPPIHNAGPRRFFGGCCGCMGYCGACLAVDNIVVVAASLVAGRAVAMAAVDTAAVVAAN